jgi:AsmA protein
MRAQQKLSGISIGRCCAMRRTRMCWRQGNVTLDVTTTGTLVSELKRALNGSARMELRDGAIKGIDLAGACAASSRSSAARMPKGAAARKRKTDFSELSASFASRTASRTTRI